LILDEGESEQYNSKHEIPMVTETGSYDLCELHRSGDDAEYPQRGMSPLSEKRARRRYIRA
jgi:hypothetical protein